MLDTFARDGMWDDVGGGTYVVLVVGPPGAGKSTWVEQHRRDGDVVIDYDRLAVATGGTGHSDRVWEPARVARAALLDAVRKGRLGACRVWLVSANPAAEAVFPHNDVVLVDPGYDVVLERCREADRPSSWFGLVSDWYRRRR